MAVRRIAEEQPESFVFDEANLAWAKNQLEKYPEGKQASAVIPLLWRAQEQHDGWLPEPAMRYIADMLDMPFIRVMEVATFYTMFQLKPVGSVAHIQVCGTTPCMLRGSEDIIKICKKRISEQQHTVTADGRMSWEEVECLGACVNAPMVQIFKDTFEDLTPETFEALLDAIDNGQAVKPGPQTGRHLSVAEGGRTQLFEDAMDYGPQVDSYIESYVMAGSADQIAREASAFGLAPFDPASLKAANGSAKKVTAKPAAANVAKESPKPAEKTETKEPAKPAKAKAEKPKETAPVVDASNDDEETAVAAKLAALGEGASPEDKASAVGKKPRGLKAPRKSGADDLKRVKGIGPVNEKRLNGLGIFHFDQIAKWGRPEVLYVQTLLNFPGRIDREKWIDQAADLAGTSSNEETSE
ncbi:MAG: NADH-quinone oxidoreductase subunit NuoE [Pseudomonadota bacterium]